MQWEENEKKTKKIKKMNMMEIKITDNIKEHITLKKRKKKLTHIKIGEVLWNFTSEPLRAT